MDSVEMDLAEKKSEEASDAELLLSDASDPNGLDDIPLMSPRIGDEYQAAIPPMLTLSQLLEFSTNPIESQATTDTASRLFLIGLPIPFTWICNEANTSKDEHKKKFRDPSDTMCSSKFPGPGNVTKSVSPLNKKEERPKVDTANYFPVPGLSAESWNDFEVESLTLGLYIFGKNLLQVQRFMESKDTGQIQCFYYGRFYKSPRYCKWVDCRKMRNKKRVMGSKIFTDYRQQELLSRLSPHLSEEAKKTFQEISNALAEERTSLEEYVSTLKRIVGIRVLVEAVRIGKGKEDLTTLITDMAKSGNRQRVRPPELPSGKACSSLTSADIVKFLTSDFRLSKARSNDLFWEAVWPRLLAKGWHSEQPNDICTAPKNSLVFLMPGVKKFSRRKLTNGIQYFDSVSDVLRKVASEPVLIDLEVEETRPENSKEENSGLDHVDDQKDKERPRYLQPQGVANVMKFTVIDTSFPSKVKELRSLPAEEKHSSASSSKSRENSTHSYGSSDTKTRENGVSQKLRNTGLIQKSAVKQEVYLPAEFSSADQQVRTIKHHSSRREKTGGKRQRLADKQEEPIFVLSLPASTDKNFVHRECSSKGKESVDVKVSPKRVRGSEPLGQPHLLLIDLNLPHVPTEEDHEQCDIMVKSEPMESSTGCGDISEEVPSVSGRRLSTRTRPLTTKALEALEIGFLSLRQSRKRASPGALDRKTRSTRQDRSDEVSYGETGSDGKMDVVTSPLIQNNETAWPLASELLRSSYEVCLDDVESIRESP